MVTSPRELKQLYSQGVNIMQFLRDEKGLNQNTGEIIEVAYDMQAGSYVAAMDEPERARLKKDYTLELARVISSLCTPETVLEAGVGEATTLCWLLKQLSTQVRGFGFDLSWSRVAHARRYLTEEGIGSATLCTGNLLNIPFATDSIDVVYTSHSIEPNCGKEEPILKELFRITRKFLVLLEPGYEFAGQEARTRMEHYGYCRNLRGIADSLGYEVIRNELFRFTANPLNPTAITVIKKVVSSDVPTHVFACPKFKTPLEKISDMFYSPEALVVYPVIGGIPCLREDNGVFASSYKEICGESK